LTKINLEKLLHLLVLLKRKMGCILLKKHKAGVGLKLDMPVPFVCGIPFVVGKEANRSHFEAGATEQVEDHTACHQSQTLMSELSSRTKQLQALSRQKLKSGCGAVTRPHNR
jgi:hypothetical protein